MGNSATLGRCLGTVSSKLLKGTLTVCDDRMWNAAKAAIAGKSRQESKDYRAREAAKLRIGKLDTELDDAKEKLVAQQKLIAELEGKREELVATAAGKRLADDELGSDVRKKFKYSENPFLAEKSSYNKRRFEINNPFCTVVEVKSLEAMPADKVCDGQFMDKNALTTAARILLEPIAETRRRWKCPRTELGGRIIHASALHGVKWLTLPPGSPKNHKVADALLTAGGTEVVFRADDEILSEDEANLVDWNEFMTVEKYDLKGQHHDLSIDGDNLVTALLVECDWEGSLRKLYQGAGHGVTAALENLAKGCTEPLYIENWSKSSWRYGVLRPQAIVTVKGGRVVGVKGPRTDGLSLDQLQSKLEECKATLQDEYISPSQYPDRDYVLGTLHVCDCEEMALPNTVKDNFLSVHALRFLQSLVRIFVGDDRALRLTEKDILWNVAMRKAEIEQDMDTFMVTLDSAYNQLVASKVTNAPAPTMPAQVKNEAVEYC